MQNCLLHSNVSEKKIFFTVTSLVVTPFYGKIFGPLMSIRSSGRNTPFFVAKNFWKLPEEGRLYYKQIIKWSTFFISWHNFPAGWSISCPTCMFLHVYRPTQGSQEFQECLIHICSLGLRRKKQHLISRIKTTTAYLSNMTFHVQVQSKSGSTRLPLVLKLIAYHVAQNFKGHFLSFLHIKQVYGISCSTWNCIKLSEIHLKACLWGIQLQQCRRHTAPLRLLQKQWWGIKTEAKIKTYCW